MPEIMIVQNTNIIIPSSCCCTSSRRIKLRQLQTHIVQGAIGEIHFEFIWHSWYLLLGHKHTLQYKQLGDNLEQLPHDHTKIKWAQKELLLQFVRRGEDRDLFLLSRSFLCTIWQRHKYHLNSWPIEEVEETWIMLILRSTIKRWSHLSNDRPSPASQSKAEAEWKHH